VPRAVQSHGYGARVTPRRAYALTLAAAALAVAGCSSSPSDNSASQTIVVHTAADHAAASKPATHSPSPAAKAAPSPTCDMTKEPNVLVWYKVPGLQDSAQLLGGWSPETCKSSVDQIMAGSPTGDGYCTEIAMASDNPGYNADATPAKPLKHVIEAIGGSC